MGCKMEGKKRLPEKVSLSMIEGGERLGKIITSTD
jgi:hypothetical protein